MLSRAWVGTAGALLLSLAPLRAQAAEAPRVLDAHFDGVISPVAAEYLDGAIARANDEHFDLLVIELDTPGGLDTSMRDIVKAELASETPIAVYVAPSGARAASAGVFITMAANIAAMAPGTNIGAAHPVMLGGGPGGDAKESEDYEKKVANDAAAYLKSIAHKRGRNESWAYLAVTQSTSTPAEDAVKEGVVDFVAKDLNDLLAQADGRTPPGLDHPIHSKGGVVTDIEMSERQRFLAALADPNVALMLMSLGSAGILIEIYSPGLIFPGVVGVVSLLLGLYSFQTLSVNMAGLALILFGIALFLLEIKVASYGILTVGGAISFVLGALMLFNKQPESGLSVSLSLLGSTVGAIAVFVGFVAWLTFRVQRKKPVTGAEGLVGSEGQARTALDPKGTIFIAGELWNAESVSGPIPQGADVVVVEVKGLSLKVRAK